MGSVVAMFYYFVCTSGFVKAIDDIVSSDLPDLGDFFIVILSLSIHLIMTKYLHSPGCGTILGLGALRD